MARAGRLKRNFFPHFIRTLEHTHTQDQDIAQTCHMETLVHIHIMYIFTVYWYSRYMHHFSYVYIFVCSWMCYFIPYNLPYNINLLHTVCIVCLFEIVFQMILNEVWTWRADLQHSSPVLDQYELNLSILVWFLMSDMHKVIKSITHMAWSFNQTKPIKQCS